jgi:hypothetical protein
MSKRKDLHGGNIDWALKELGTSAVPSTGWKKDERKQVVTNDFAGRDA